GHRGMLATQGLFRNKRDRSVIVGKIVGHSHDIVTHLISIRALFQHDETLTLMLLPCSQLRPYPAADLLDRFHRRHRVLHGSTHARHPAYGIRMALAQALTPE